MAAGQPNRRRDRGDESGVEIVEPHQANHAATEPDAFRVSGRSVDRLRRLDEFVRSCADFSLATSAVWAGFAVPGLPF